MTQISPTTELHPLSLTDLDREWLLSQPRSPFRDHIESILNVHDRHDSACINTASSRDDVLSQHQHIKKIHASLIDQLDQHKRLIPDEKADILSVELSIARVNLAVIRRNAQRDSMNIEDVLALDNVRLHLIAIEMDMNQLSCFQPSSQLDSKDTYRAMAL